MDLRIDAFLLGRLVVAILGSSIWAVVVPIGVGFGIISAVTPGVIPGPFNRFILG